MGMGTDHSGGGGVVIISTVLPVSGHAVNKQQENIKGEPAWTDATNISHNKGLLSRTCAACFYFLLMN